jgi:hypothetical protein
VLIEDAADDDALDESPARDRFGGGAPEADVASMLVDVDSSLTSSSRLSPSVRFFEDRVSLLEETDLGAAEKYLSKLIQKAVCCL